MQIENKITIDKAWKILFERYNIISKVSVNGFFKIKSSEINTVKEARLMAKFDQSTQLPEIFQHNKLSILPISRGEYIIGNFKTHSFVPPSQLLFQVNNLYQAVCIYNVLDFCEEFCVFYGFHIFWYQLLVELYLPYIEQLLQKDYFYSFPWKLCLGAG